MGILLGPLLLTAAVLGQGQLIFANSSATLITNVATQAAWATAPNSTVAIYAMSGFGQPQASLVLQPGAVTNLFLPGRFLGGIRTLNLPGGPATVQVRAWGASTAFPSEEAAFVAAFGGDPSVTIGRSVLMDLIITEGLAPPPTLTANGLNAFTVGVPEPSTFALGLLGALIFVWGRRRRS